MRGTIRSYLLWGSILGITSTCFAGAPRCTERASRAAIVVRAYNYSRIPDTAITRASKEAARILGRAGVDARWVDCATSPSEVNREPACALSPGPSELILKLLPRKMAERLKQRSGTLGFAVPVPHNQWLGTAFVFVEESERLAYYGSFPTSFETTRAVVLGHLIAHEIGHLLLGPDSHSHSGIMSFPWSKRVLKRIGTAHVAFTRQEAQQIRARLVEPSDFDQPRMIARSQPD